ncbi:MAG TPA: folylpolyglutamate synthase/dihydrofolate synthase family protein, partial [Elusimicrobiota bacterium]|nr:folylpolyglutamate synthase/dihydrofolate synthase family protein [Elusimicrobiota bacterium]
MIRTRLSFPRLASEARCRSNRRRTTPRIRLGLERLRPVLTRLSHPEDDFASLLIAGTNGKGSVAALLENVLRTAGYRTGLYTSPHLVSPAERVRVNGTNIAGAEWKRLLRQVADAAGRSRQELTEFESQTLAAYLHFQNEKVDIAVVEVGLGGRLDATNTLPAPEATVITSIGHDHLSWLGPTLRDVLHEKMGILRHGVPHFQSLPPSLDPRSSVGPALSSTLNRDILVKGKHVDWVNRMQVFSVSLPHGTYKNLKIHLLGRHQLNNAALAVAVLDSLKRRGWNISDSHLRRGLLRASWPGRFQVFNARPGGRPRTLLDGAHNPEAMDSLAAAYRASPWGKESATLIFGCLKDKDANGLIERLRPLVRRVFTVPLPTTRSRSARTLARMWSRFRPA